MKRKSIALAMCLPIVCGTACADATPRAEESASPSAEIVYESPYVPAQVTIAGETVSMDREDMYERLDRELTSIAYAHGSTMLTLKRANKYFPVFAPILEANGIPGDFVYLAAIESNLSVRAYSRSKAAGLWQFIAETGKQYGLEVNDEVDERYDPEKATIAACKYLKEGYEKYGNWTTVAASYNAGMGKISKELTRQIADNSFDLYLTEETSRYVFRLIAMKLVLENPRKYGFSIKRDQLYQPIGYTTEKVTGAVPSWAEWAKKRGITYAQLRELNPWIRSASLTNKRGKTYTVKIPVATDLYRSKKELKVYNENWVVD